MTEKCPVALCPYILCQMAPKPLVLGTEVGDGLPVLYIGGGTNKPLPGLTENLSIFPVSSHKHFVVFKRPILFKHSPQSPSLMPGPQEGVIERSEWG